MNAVNPNLKVAGLLTAAAKYAAAGAMDSALRVVAEAFDIGTFESRRMLVPRNYIGSVAHPVNGAERFTNYEVSAGVNGRVVVRSQQTGVYFAISHYSLVDIAVARGIDLPAVAEALDGGAR